MPVFIKFHWNKTMITHSYFMYYLRWLMCLQHKQCGLQNKKIYIFTTLPFTETFADLWPRQWNYLKCTITSGFFLLLKQCGLSSIIISFPLFSDSFSLYSNLGSIKSDITQNPKIVVDGKCLSRSYKLYNTSRWSVSSIYSKQGNAFP